jgi:UDP-3-O-[3-hydroxymyristoyl] glucosamine N-acyltransferase
LAGNKNVSIFTWLILLHVENWATMQTTVAEIANLVGGRLLRGNEETIIRGFANLTDALPGDLSFFHDRRYLAQLAKTQACALLVPEDFTEFPDDAACIAVADPSRSFELVVERYGVQPEPFVAGVHPTAVIGATVKLDVTKVSVSAHAVIEDGTALADGVQIGAGCYVGRNVTIGADSKLFANSTVHAGCELGARVILHSGVVIGADGFGYEFKEGRHRKIRQSGIVQIDDDVEIGASTTVDRARFGRTWIGEGTKIDNQVQIGHNVVIGKHCIIVAFAAIAGSAQVGDYVVIGAQVGIGGHVKVGSQSMLAARCGVTKHLAPGQTYMGFPAVLASEERRRLAGINRLPQLVARVKQLESDVRGKKNDEGAVPSGA